MNKNFRIYAIDFIKNSFLTIFLLGLLFSVNSQAQDWPDKFVDSLAGNYLKSNDNNALIIGVNIYGKEKIYYYGGKEKGSSIKPDETSLFEIGQITQAFTSILYAEMTANGFVRADDELQKLLPVNVPSPEFQKIVCNPVTKDVLVPSSPNSYNKFELTDFVCKPDPESPPQPILLCYLSTHTSGLPDRPGNLRGGKTNPYANYTKENLYDFLRSYTIPKRIGFDFLYSNLGVALLGHAMELKAKRSYEDLIVDSICMKLGMPDTKITLSDAGQKNFLNGYTPKGELAPHWTYGIMAPCGALHSNIRDMMNFLSANLGTKQTAIKDILDYTHNPRIIFHDKKYGDASIGLSWFVNPINVEKRNYVWQSGLMGGFASFIGFVETSKTGVVILSNSSIPTEDLGKTLLRRIEESTVN